MSGDSSGGGAARLLLRRDSPGSWDKSRPTDPGAHSPPTPRLKRVGSILAMGDGAVCTTPSDESAGSSPTSSATSSPSPNYPMRSIFVGPEGGAEPKKITPRTARRRLARWARKRLQLHRVVRPFICSTFRDMTAERNYLTAKVWPRVTLECEKQMVRFHARDLRWGVTAAECAQGEVIKRCLDEVGRCKPFLICILGDAYGWCRDTDPGIELSLKVAAEKYPW